MRKKLSKKSKYIIDSTYSGQINVFKEKYTVELIQNADQEGLQKISEDIKDQLKGLKIEQSELSKKIKNPKDYPDLSKETEYNYKTHFQSINEIIDYLESMREFAESIENRKYFIQVGKDLTDAIKRENLKRLTAPAYQIAELAKNISNNIPATPKSSLLKGTSNFQPSKSKDHTKVAPVKYKAKHFREVDTLRKTLKTVEAITKVAEKHGFSVDGFRQQYYSRWLPSKKK